MTQAIVLTLGAALLVGAAIQDLAARTISNSGSVCLALLGVILRVGDGTFVIGLIIATALFVIALAFWKFGWLGGGDVKLLAASAMLLPPATVPGFLMGVSLSGGVLSLIYLGTRRRISKPHSRKPDGLLARSIRVETWRLHRGGPLPYAVAIAFGALNVLFHEGIPR